MRNCLDVRLGQIICDKDGVVDWCIVLVEMLLTRFKQCWPLPTESLPELAKNLNIVTLNRNPIPLANQLWCIDFLTPPTPLIIPHRLRAFLESRMPLKNWCSIRARWSKSSLKHSIRFCGIFSKFKTVLWHIVLLKCPHVQIAFLKFTSCDYQSLVRCIPIAAVAVHLKLKS